MSYDICGIGSVCLIGGIAKSMKKQSFKKGDKVRIINPQIFIRCGYPETIESAGEKMEKWFKEKYGKSLESHLLEFFPFLSDPLISEYKIILEESSFDFDKIKESFYRAYLKNELNFGGRERRVYTKYEPQLEGKICKIISEKPMIKKSGNYVHSSGGRGPDDDYEPAYLRDVKTHVFYEVVSYELNPFFSEWVERENLEKCLTKSELSSTVTITI